MVRRLLTATAALAALAGGLVGPTGMAFAQRSYAEPVDGLADYYLNGPPDIPGCPQDCARDFSPCDPPAYKRADNRCSNRSSGRH